MKIKTVNMRASAGKRATVDLVLMALFASLGLATKNVIHPLVATLAGPLYIPTGALAGGIYMMWPVMAYGFVRKTGAATVTSLTQAFISLLLPFGNFGLLSFVIYLAPGLAIDGFFLLSRHKACCAGCCLGAGAVANAVGTVLVGSLILVLPEYVLLFIALVAAISGGIGGLIANMLLVRTRKLGLRVNEG
ncbi:MAG: ECF transporter S component [Candidatus Bathyarchaeia archaeon]|jgi:ABC-type thiamin/hydroxymethylpyrimidine transport system permease subunit